MTTATVPESTARTLSRAVLLRDQKVASHRDSCRALVARCARGDEIAPEAILKSLDHWGIPVEQFQDDVELLIRRTELRADFDAGAGAQSAIYAIAEQRAQAEAERDMAVAKAKAECERVISEAKSTHDSIVHPLVEQERIALAARDRAGQAESELRESASDEAKAIVDEARKSLDEARSKISPYVAGSRPSTVADELGRRLIKSRSELSGLNSGDSRGLVTWGSIERRKQLDAEIVSLVAKIEAAKNPPPRSPDPELVTALAEAEKRLAVATENLLIP